MAEINNVMVFCVTHGKGISHKKGSPRPYDFASMEYIVPASNIDMQDCNISSWGYQSKSIGVKNEPAILARLSKCPLLVPVTLVIEFDPQDFTKLLAVDFKTDLPVADDFGGDSTTKAPVTNGKSVPVTESKF